MIKLQSALLAGLVLLAGSLCPDRNGQAFGAQDGQGGRGVQGKNVPTAASQGATAASDRNTARAGYVFRDCPDCPEMVVIPAGEFTMTDAGNTSGAPAHKVKLEHDFAYGQTEVTEAQFRYFLRRTGYNAGEGWKTELQSEKRPAVNLDWYAASAYVRWLSRYTGKRYRLPAETEWAYAAHGGKATRYWWGDSAGDGCGKEHLSILFFPMGQECASAQKQGLTDVASLSTNPWGLHDMLGNAGEWTADAKACGGLDFFHPYHEAACSTNDFEINPAHTGFRVVRELP